MSYRLSPFGNIKQEYLNYSVEYYIYNKYSEIILLLLLLLLYFSVL